MRNRVEELFTMYAALLWALLALNVLNQVFHLYTPERETPAVYEHDSAHDRAIHTEGDN